MSAVHTHARSTDKAEQSGGSSRSSSDVHQNHQAPWQRSLGNRLLQGVVQAKLSVGEANDEYEREADRVAETVVGMALPPNDPQARGAFNGIAKDNTLNVRRKCASCLNEEEDAAAPIYIRRKANNNHSVSSLNPDVQSGIESIRGQGRPLSASLRNYFEPRFGRDFSQVRIQTDSQAAALSQSLQAKAFTLGSNIVFAANQYSPETISGKKLLAHELTHVVQQSYEPSNVIRRQPLTQAQLNRICYRSGTHQPSPSAREPALHVTYESWLAAFANMATFTSNDTAPGHTANSRFQVLGTQARRYGDRTATTDNRPTPVTGGLWRGERFIDHPTNEWVNNCLPPNLRATAYQLPSDCADIAVILRHVWLAAHHRTERYRGWTVGDSAGNANQRRARRLIRRVVSANAAGMVNAYSDAQGNPLLNFDQVKNLLHPGDVLVWEHRKTSTRGGRTRARRSGGHVQTVTEVVRSGNNVTGINVIQGNQPIFSDAATEILRQGGVRRPNPNSRAGQSLRNSPGRRIESDTAISTANITSPVSGDSIWGSIDERNADGSVAEFTVIVAAGPPRAAARPRMQNVGGQRIRRLSDWFNRLGSASLSRLQGVLESALMEARSIIDGGNTVSNSDATALGTRAGENLWEKATAAVRRLSRAGNRNSRNLLRGDVGTRTHFEPLHRMRATIRALGGIHPPVYRGNPSAAANVRTTFAVIDREFNFAARGGSSISFNRSLRRGGELVKVLVTGFDPFSASPPPAGDWNPAGATAMALDDQEVNLGNHNKAAVESVVYPVSFAQFRQGIVERVARTVNADAILTISLNPNVASTAPVQIEQFTVGVHNLSRLQPHRLFPAEPASPISGLRGIPGGGDAILESNAAADMSGIAADTERVNSRGRVTTQRPTVASDITFRLASQTQAQQFLTALGLSQTTNGSTVVISNAQAINTIMNNSVRISDAHGHTADITVTLNNTAFRVTIVRGPGGRFLSNEVAYRTQRQLRSQGSNATSFHTHVPPADTMGALIPQSGSRRARRAALWSARNTVRRLVTTMRRMIRAVGIRIIQRRQQNSGTP